MDVYPGGHGRMAKMSSFNKHYEDITAQVEKAPMVQLLLRLKKVNSPIILYGCGEQANLILEVCQHYRVSVTGIADSVKRGYFLDTGMKIHSPKDLLDTYPNAEIIITSWKFDGEIYQYLIRLGYSKTKIHKFPLSHPYFLMQNIFEERYIAGYRWAYDFFKDDLSKQIILNRISAYLLDKKMMKTSKNPMYFEFSLSEKEVFLQAGCFDGDTVKQYEKYYDTQQRHDIYTFEADPQAFEISKQNLIEFKNVHLIPKGLWSTESVLTFYTDDMSGSASFLNGKNNEIKVPVTSLDIFFADKPKPTMIQLDIEGAELEALKGAESIIRAHKPKLAICVYHKYEDIYEIPKLLHQYYPAYRFWLQHCANGIYDTVLYAE